MYVGDKQHFMSVCIFLLFPEGWNNEPCWEVIGNSPYLHRSVHILYKPARDRLQ